MSSFASDETENRHCDWETGGTREINPLRWKREYQIAFFAAAMFGAVVGFFIGLRQTEPSTQFYWLHVGAWGVVGGVFAAVGAFVRQLLRGQNSTN